MPRATNSRGGGSPTGGFPVQRLRNAIFPKKYYLMRFSNVNVKMLNEMDAEYRVIKNNRSHTDVQHIHPHGSSLPAKKKTWKRVSPQDEAETVEFFPYPLALRQYTVVNEEAKFQCIAKLK